ncbi:hypothetical protein [Lactiplantibacillus plantarum]|uniref:hypothetical protein n=1 Tax=Lactiplantibacillus plantarum TaxID=1590 RepID=UPI00280A9911|nr:hypothetical protein [Lactiplantibacillus plantarum]
MDIPTRRQQFKALVQAQSTVISGATLRYYPVVPSPIFITITLILAMLLASLLRSSVSTLPLTVNTLIYRLQEVQCQRLSFGEYQHYCQI